MYLLQCLWCAALNFSVWVFVHRVRGARSWSVSLPGGWALVVQVPTAKSPPTMHEGNKAVGGMGRKVSDVAGCSSAAAFVAEAADTAGRQQSSSQLFSQHCVLATAKVRLLMALNQKGREGLATTVGQPWQNCCQFLKGSYGTAQTSSVHFTFYMSVPRWTEDEVSLSEFFNKLWSICQVLALKFAVRAPWRRVIVMLQLQQTKQIFEVLRVGLCVSQRLHQASSNRIALYLQQTRPITMTHSSNAISTQAKLEVNKEDPGVFYFPQAVVISSNVDQVLISWDLCILSAKMIVCWQSQKPCKNLSLGSSCCLLQDHQI